MAQGGGLLCLECSLHVARHRVRLCSWVESAAKAQAMHGVVDGHGYSTHGHGQRPHVTVTMVAANPPRATYDTEKISMATAHTVSDEAYGV